MKFPVNPLRIIGVHALLLLSATLYSQYQLLNINDIEQLTELPEQLAENSGIIMTPYNTLIGHNDRGHKARLYEFDMQTGLKIRTIEIDNAKNKDWEDITSDSEYIYIGDVGNNRGKREKLKIYRIRWPEQGSERISVEAEKIKFRYSDQTNFEKRKKHNYDCEAIVSYGDSIYLFTKNRADLHTNVCALSKVPGEYVIAVTRRFDSDGLITGADIFAGGKNEKNKILGLIGYNKSNKRYEPFIWTFTDFDSTNFFSGNAARVDLPLHIQAEGILFFNAKKVLFTNEEEQRGVGSLYQIKTRTLMGH